MKKQNVSFNDAVTRIEEIVKSIESGEPDIDKLSEKVKEASDLIKFCKEKLHETESKIEDIIKEE
jgi:exodeoxyribonuclease VII small subunit